MTILNNPFRNKLTFKSLKLKKTPCTKMNFFMSCYILIESATLPLLNGIQL